MDLRVRLLAFLSACSLVLLFAAGATVVSSLRDDVAEEMAASARLVDLMLSIGEAREHGGGRIERLLANGELRHLRVEVERADLEQASPAGAVHGPLVTLAQRLSGVNEEALAARSVALADRSVIRITPDPESEICEILTDAARMFALLAAFVSASLAAAWYAADRALRPVRELEAGIERLARGELRRALPVFELREFRRIAGALDRLADALAHARANERRLARCLIDLQETERRELARELHDEFGQSLTAVGVAAAFIERHAAGAAPEALAESARDIRGESSRMAVHVRSLLRQLRPHGLEGLGMRDALRELIDGWRARSPQIAVVADLATGLPSVSAAAGLTLYRTLQEALTNVYRHAAATEVTVSLTEEASAIVLKVSDNGGGRAADVASRARGGLLGMRERAEMAGGRLELCDSEPGGLSVILRLPIGQGET
jgi:two-component system sensor histidine kinase UhpB